MNNDLKIDSSGFELPEDAKVCQVFERLMRVYAAMTDNGLHEAYYEKHDKYEERYGIMF